MIYLAVTLFNYLMLYCYLDWQALVKSQKCDIIDWHYDRGLNNSKLTVWSLITVAVCEFGILTGLLLHTKTGLQKFLAIHEFSKQSRQIDIAVKTVNCFLYNEILQPWTDYFSFWIKLNKFVCVRFYCILNRLSFWLKLYTW
jgi:hypothetical protein